MSNGAAQASGGATYRMLRELGSRAQHSYAAIREPSELLVAHRFVRSRARAAAELASEAATPLDGEAMALLLRDARCLEKNWHPNIARVRHVDLASKPQAVLTIGTELLDGATLEDLIDAARPERASARDPLLALPVLVRILLDVLGGLHALHGLRDGMNATLGAMHGELCPANVVVGRDGVARIVNVLRKRPVRIVLGSEAVAYAAPEALDGDGSEDPRSDVYAVGVMLWEGLAGRRLYDEVDPAAVLSRQREGELAPPSIHPSSPFARLSEVAIRALSFDPALRYRGASEMAAELRKIAGTKLASGALVAAWVTNLAGDRIRMRRALLDPTMSGTRRRASDRSILAAEAASALDTDPGAAVFVPSLPPLPPPVARQLTRKAGALRASPRRVVPTLQREVPVGLIAASRPSMPDAADDLVAEDLEDDDDLPGPRGSSPELDLEAVLATLALHASRGERAERAERAEHAERAPGVEHGAASEPHAATAPSDPESTELLISKALATATAQMRAELAERGARTPALSKVGSPGDFVLPAPLTETLNEAAPRQRRHLVGVALAATLFLIAMGAFLALRGSWSSSRSPASSASSTSSTSSASSTNGSPATASTPPSAMPAMPAPVVGARAATAPSEATPRAAAHATAAPPPAKAKNSIYEPDGI